MGNTPKHASSTPKRAIKPEEAGEIYNDPADIAEAAMNLYRDFLRVNVIQVERDYLQGRIDYAKGSIAAISERRETYSTIEQSELITRAYKEVELIEAQFKVTDEMLECACKVYRERRKAFYVIAKKFLDSEHLCGADA